jgi:methionine aminopeptidase
MSAILYTMAYDNSIEKEFFILNKHPIYYITTEMEEEKKKCPSCRCNKVLSLFHGMRGTPTTKCISCNKIMANYSHKRHEKEKLNKKEQEKQKIIEEYLLSISTSKNIDGGII